MPCGQWVSDLLSKCFPSERPTQLEVPCWAGLECWESGPPWGEVRERRQSPKACWTLVLSTSDDNLLKNIELFDKLALRFHGRLLFLKDVLGDEICCWSFYGQGRKIAEVCCTSIVYATEKKQTKVRGDQGGMGGRTGTLDRGQSGVRQGQDLWASRARVLRPWLNSLGRSHFSDLCFSTFEMRL